MARYNYGPNFQVADAFHRWGDPTHVTQLASGKYNTSSNNRAWWMLPEDNTSGLFDLTGGRLKWPWDPDVNEAGNLIPNKEGLGTTGNNFWNWLKTTPKKVVTGTGKTKAEENIDKGFFHQFYDMSPKEFLEMQGAEARKGVDHMLGSQLKYNLVTKQIPQIGRQIGLGGAPFEYQGALADARNSTAVTIASKMNPGPVRYLQPYRSYFS
tara:strand:- start:279 stop:908 length:630 start_codon:yes stop_codon:yes gene_type:complete